MIYDEEDNSGHEIIQDEIPKEDEATMIYDEEDDSSHETTQDTNSTEFSSKCENKNIRDNAKKVNFAIINARSLVPKIDSLVENFEERGWAFAIVTETWFVQGPIYEQTILDLKMGHGIDAVCQNRRATAGRNTGGGAAIVAKRSKMSIKTYPFKKND